MNKARCNEDLYFAALKRYVISFIRCVISCGLYLQIYITSKLLQTPVMYCNHRLNVFVGKIASYNIYLLSLDDIQFRKLGNWSFIQNR